MLERLGHFLVRRRKFVIWGTLALLVLAGAVGGNVSKHLKAGGFDATAFESSKASKILGDTFHQAPPNFLVLVTAKQGTVDEGAAKAAGIAATNELRGKKGVGQVLSHWDLGVGSPLESRGHGRAMIVAELQGNDSDQADLAKVLTTEFNRDTADVSMRVGGFNALFAEVSDHIEKDLQKAEMFAGIITLALLVVVFGSVVAAGLPLAVGIIAVFGTFLVLRVIATLTDVSVFALSMVTAMGLGLAIDYSLFIVSRFREELRKGHDTETAVVTTVRTAGRTIIFGGVTVAVSLMALLVFPLYFFKSFGYAGVGVVLTAVFGAVIFLPAVLASLGPNVDKWSLWARHPKEVGEGFWHRMAVVVMKRPIPIATGVVVVLLLLGAPFLHVNLGLPDERVLPKGASTRTVHETIRRDFGTEEVNSIRVLVPKLDNPIQQRAQIGEYASKLSQLKGVKIVESLGGDYVNGEQVAQPGPASARFVAVSSTWFQVIPSIDPYSKDAEAIVTTIRDDTSGPFQVIVGGSSAQLVDAKDALFGALPWAIVIIVVATFILLFLMFGSLLVPLKALVLNFLSLTATFGAMVWIFQDGHLAGLLHFTPSSALDISSPILMFCIAFGLSMDYEVFLLSRIKEEYDATHDNEHSVAVGLERTGRIVTAAAVLISVVFLAFGTSGIRFIKLFGIGMSLAVLMDAFVIRGTLVPAFMRLAGEANWWLPGFLKPIYNRFQIKEVHEVEAPSPEPEPVAKTPVRKKPVARKAKPAPKRKPTTAKKAVAKKPAARKATAARKSTTARKKPAARRAVR